MAGIGVGKALRLQAPTTPIVFCSIADDDDTAIRALSVGAAGYVSKDLSSEALRRALRGAVDGEAAISRRLARRLVEELCRQPEPRPRLRPLGGELTAREWEVLDLLIDGESTLAIAQTLGLALETVRSHIKHVLRKLGVGTRGEAVAIAQRLRARRVSSGAGPARREESRSEPDQAEKDHYRNRCILTNRPRSKVT